MELTILLGSFTLLLLIGVPVAFALGAAALATVLYMDLPPIVVFQQLASGMNVFSMLAIPFFIFAGDLMMRGQIADRLVALAAAMVGHLRGGLGQVNIVAATLFGGVSGSAVADASAVGGVMIPQMKARGYAPDYAVNVTANAALIDLLIPPSHNMIVYVIAAGGAISVADLFTAGIIPGIVMMAALMVVAWLVAVRRGYPQEAFPGWAVLLRLMVAAVPGLMLIVIIFAGVRSGVFTATESACIAVLYALLVTLLVYRSLSWEGFTEAVGGAARTTGMVMLIIGTASAFGWLMALLQVPAQTVALMRGITEDPLLTLLVINIVLLLLGTFMDMAPLIMIGTPIFLPVVKALGMDPVQFGIVLIVNLGIGTITPPVGPVLFVACAVGKVSMWEATKTSAPFYLAMVVVLLLVTYVPALSLWLPAQFH
ncbi:TRAP transporter large permease [Siccirubricoccus sp. KC 17139]|uniref:TRAP transporter large permease protein n=1 Tax=Siccirubricoccus soli TaxID=2899147 RepID=A0ABT1DB70_9PROT|nr:TRAP transporter large permease [Siccirubricoccus soli]MCO6419186.1 TRAP transporter large permease [Siccirubricoccus soli]MCP2685321.1 TRAP transporter large permease [Siccirubricoccus soli]